MREKNCLQVDDAVVEELGFVVVAAGPVGDDDVHDVLGLEISGAGDDDGTIFH
jgi:hypothetical protein